MNPVEIFQGRYACKHYDPERDVPEEVFGRIIEAARLTPSAMNVQPWHIYVFDRASRQNSAPPSGISISRGLTAARKPY